ncbi:helix-turn-helix domain-containing protein [Agrobacterium vitis]|uniref:helix-turn-helix domain-containing protein n=1 Tax=Agrobacterium vitis TaxID=373 RepID=UPI0015DADBD0|nr:helix-turn-helix domain-containing protein [Agrobacterium vitis]BCH65849.1 helix-turn-helix domain-containing protein [Agrobacterium vitis]
MMEPDHGATSRAWSWRHAVAKSGLPPITRLVLHTLGLKMDATGGSCYPPVSELVELSGLDKKTILKHLDLAEQAGWIEVTQHGFRGQKWKRNEYIARWPGRDLAGHAAAGFVANAQAGGGDTPPFGDEILPEGGGAVPPACAEKVVEMAPEGGGNGSTKVVEQLHQDKILPANSPNNSPTAGAGRGEFSREELRKIDLAFKRWYPTWPNYDKSSDTAARKAWFALTADQRAACIEKTPAYILWIGKGTFTFAAVFLRDRAWEKMPEVAPAVQTHATAKVCGKLWMGRRLETLLCEPTGQFAFTAFDNRRLASGAISREALVWEKRREHGWPLVSRMRDLARRNEPFVTSVDLLPLVASFERVESGSTLFAAWKRLHERRGWMFVEGLRDWNYFPPIDPDQPDLDAAVEAALDHFQTSLSEGRTHDAA